jgi:hypothetical protein
MAAARKRNWALGTPDYSPLGLYEPDCSAQLAMENEALSDGNVICDAVRRGYGAVYEA